MGSIACLKVSIEPLCSSILTVSSVPDVVTDEAPTLKPKKETPSYLHISQHTTEFPSSFAQLDASRGFSVNAHNKVCYLPSRNSRLNVDLARCRVTYLAQAIV